MKKFLEKYLSMIAYVILFNLLFKFCWNYFDAGPRYTFEYYVYSLGLFCLTYFPIVFFIEKWHAKGKEIK